MGILNTDIRCLVGFHKWKYYSADKGSMSIIRVCCCCPKKQAYLRGIRPYLDMEDIQPWPPSPMASIIETPFIAGADIKKDELCILDLSTGILIPRSLSWPAFRLERSIEEVRERAACWASDGVVGD